MSKKANSGKKFSMGKRRNSSKKSVKKRASKNEQKSSDRSSSNSVDSILEPDEKSILTDESVPYENNENENNETSHNECEPHDVEVKSLSDIVNKLNSDQSNDEDETSEELQELEEESEPEESPSYSFISELIPSGTSDHGHDKEKHRTSERGEQMCLEIDDPNSKVDQSPEQVARKKLKSIIESLVFVADKPVTIAQLRKSTRTKKAELMPLIDELMQEYTGRGMELVSVGGGYLFRSSPVCAPYVRDFVAQRPVRLTQAQLETLSIVAYRQPVTRPEIEEIRGVDTGSAVKVLLERGLIKMLGRKDEPGRPLLYGTTQYFLEFFGMLTLKDLPTLREFSDLNEESRELFKRKTGENPEEPTAEYNVLGWGENEFPNPSDEDPNEQRDPAFEDEVEAIRYEEGIEDDPPGLDTEPFGNNDLPPDLETRDAPADPSENKEWDLDKESQLQGQEREVMRPWEDLQGQEDNVDGDQIDGRLLASKDNSRADIENLEDDIDGVDDINGETEYEKNDNSCNNENT